MLNTLLANIISFPGLNIGPFTVDPVAFNLPLPWVEGGHNIMWYGIIISIAMVIGFLIAHKKAKLEGISSDDVFDLSTFLIIFCMIGARLYYVIMKPENFKSLYDVIAIWGGGLAIYGGVIAGVITIAVFCKIKKLNAAKLLDAAAPGLIIGQAIGRWGNFMNAEAYGSATDLPWRMGIIHDGIGPAIYVHPTFLYESLWNLIGFILLMCLYKKKKFNGQIAISYFVWYGFGRFFIEGLRTDSLYLLEGILGKTIRVSQLVAALCVIGGIILLIVLGKRAKNKKLDEQEYEAVYTEKNDTDVLDDGESKNYTINENTNNETKSEDIE